MADLEIKGLDERLVVIEDVLSLAAAGEFTTIDVVEEDRLGAVESGINIVLEELRDEIENTRQVNENLDIIVAERTRELEEKLEYISEQSEIISRQQEAIAELSTPILQLWDGVIALPIIGVVDTRRSSDVMERLLQEIRVRGSRYVILDITGVDLVDTKTADHFIKVVKAAQLLGARAIITGIRPAVAQTLVDIGVDLSAIHTLGTIQEALRFCIGEQGQQRRNALQK